MAETSSQEHSVETRLLYAAYSRKPINIFLVVVSTFVVGGVLWPVFPATVVSTWIIALLLCQVLGGIEVIAFRRAKPDLPISSFGNACFSRSRRPLVLPGR
ncbi:MAG: hypothetical protein IPJ25_00530 [Rhodocyclaceae bacterium]|nr:hypothetical protein [Rhodocyclaceae bacterium]